MFRSQIRLLRTKSRPNNKRTIKNSYGGNFKIARLCSLVFYLRVMHMSSACPWGRTPGQPGEYVGEYKGMNWLLCPWAGENSRHCFEFEGKGWGNSKFCKITDANHGDIRGICRFPQPINTGDVKGAKRSETENTRFRAVCKASCSQNGHLMLSMISYLNLSSGVYIPLY